MPLDFRTYLSFLGALLLASGFGILGFSYIVALGYFDQPNPDDYGAIVQALLFDALGYGFSGLGALALFGGLSGPRGGRSALAIAGAILAFLGFLTLAATAASDARLYSQQVFVEDIEGLYRAYAGGFLLAGLGLALGLLGVGLRLSRYDDALRAAAVSPFSMPAAYGPPRTTFVSGGPIEVRPPDPVAAQPSGWRPGMPTRCGTCGGVDLEYQPDGSARCRSCQAVARPVQG